MENIIIVFADYEQKEEEQLEFIELVKACAMNIQEVFVQNIKQIQFRTYIGKGKCEEIQTYLLDHEVDRVVFHRDLSPLQIRNLEEVWNTAVMDRSELILEIFSQRASSPTARLQIESAQLKKQLPRLIGSNTQLGRQSASGKNKGVGEKQLELDRRRIKTRIASTTRELKELEAQRATQRKARQKSTLPLVSLVGYTNAGKSTILNALLSYTKQSEDKKVLEKDMLFATLDTSIRRIDLPHGKSFLLSDTVGFVRELPHELIKAFHSTLEEVTYADLLLQVVDISNHDTQKQMQITKETLDKINAGSIPMLTIYNQCDKIDIDYPTREGQYLHICAKETNSIELLISTIIEQISPKSILVTLCIPYEQTSVFTTLRSNAYMLAHENKEDGIYVQVEIAENKLSFYKKYIKN